MDRPLSLAARVTLWFVATNALIGATSLILFPTRTATLFFWEIAPPINAALFGALYLSCLLYTSCPAAQDESLHSVSRLGVRCQLSVEYH